VAWAPPSFTWPRTMPSPLLGTARSRLQAEGTFLMISARSTAVLEARKGGLHPTAMVDGTPTPTATTHEQDDTYCRDMTLYLLTL
jgi:hypothetical protein